MHIKPLKHSFDGGHILKTILTDDYKAVNKKKREKSVSFSSLFHHFPLCLCFNLPEMNAVRYINKPASPSQPLSTLVMGPDSAAEASASH